MLFALTALGLVLAIAHTVVTGFHDASNALALPVRFRALTPSVGLVMSAVFNALGVLAAAYLLREWLIQGVPVPHDVVGTAAIV